jgi:hypothetical protein
MLPVDTFLIVAILVERKSGPLDIRLLGTMSRAANNNVVDCVGPLIPLTFPGGDTFVRVRPSPSGSSQNQGLANLKTIPFYAMRFVDNKWPVA